MTKGPKEIAEAMPTVSVFYGILIQMFFDDHATALPCSLCRTPGADNINNLEIIEGNIPRTALSLVREWATEHKTALLENWTLCAQMQLPKMIAPLA